jgi:Ser/Thr protein kinase RdoA (MazF antagonist)
MTRVPAAPAPDLVPPAVLGAYGVDPATLTSVPGGNINQTFFADTRRNEPIVLQRLHPVFAPEVHLDIAAVTAHIAAKGLRTPRLVPTETEALWVIAPDGGVWRALTRLDGRVTSTVPHPDVARAAARQVARFHRAVADLQHTFHFTRPGAHDTAKHLMTLAQALAEHRDHRLHAEIAPVGQAILTHARHLPSFDHLPKRLIHGDLKIANILFDHELEHAIALLDLDTLQHETIAVELGDALRSWCNPAGEDAVDAEVDPDIFAAALQGYGETSGPLLTGAERDRLVEGAERITIELAARFCADALHERYWGWNRERYESAAEHNLVRARSQLSLAESIRRHADDLRASTASIPTTAS